MEDQDVAGARPRIFVPQPIQPEGLALLSEVGEVEVAETDRMLSRDELRAALQRTDYLFAIGDLNLDGDLLDVNPNLRGIAFAAGYPDEWMDVAAATARSIPVTNIPRYPVTKTTGDLTMALILSLAWRVPQADRYTRCGKFRQEQSTLFMCHSLAGKTLGLIGLGTIGDFVAPRARAFEMRVVYTKRNRLAAEVEQRLGVDWVPSLDALLQESDFVSVLADYNESTHALIGAREFGLMKPTAFFVNTARGRIVDEDALVHALQEGTIAGAGLDVYWNEPPVSEAPAPHPALLKLDNVILIPHLGGATEESLSEIALLTARNVVAMVQGERPPNLYNPEIYEQS